MDAADRRRHRGSPGLYVSSISESFAAEWLILCRYNKDLSKNARGSGEQTWKIEKGLQVCVEGIDNNSYMRFSENIVIFARQRVCGRVCSFEWKRIEGTDEGVIGFI